MKVKIFTMAEDTIGRHELLGLQSCTGLASACPVCYHTWEPGLVGTQCCFGGYRTFLPLTSRGRQSRVQDGGHMYEYADEETRPPSALRTNQLARECLAVVEAVGVPGCKGHKHEPLIAKWPGMDWYRMCPNELVHDTKFLWKCCVKPWLGSCRERGSTTAGLTTPHTAEQTK